MKKVIDPIKIKQEIEGDIEVLNWSNCVKIYTLERDIIIIEKSKAIEVALAICPELESELKEAIELIEIMGKGINGKLNSQEIIDFQTNVSVFLTKHKNK